MRKLFLLIPALVLAMVVNATVTNINNETSDALRTALEGAADGDEIVMAAGTYVESNSDFIAFAGKSVTVRAAENANVIIQPKVPVIINGGARAHFIGVKFDASRLHESATWYEHLIYATDATDGNRLIMDDCELYNYTVGKAAIACRSSNKLDSVVINNCKFYSNTTRSCIFLEHTTDVVLEVANSTFYNIATGTVDFSAGVIDARSTTAKLRIDHCTFYNVQVKNTDYGAVKVPNSTDAIVSNSIFMMPSSYAQRAIHMKSGNAVKNCIVYNYTASTSGIHYNVTPTNTAFVDPQFTDAANANFTLATTSPAIFSSDNWTPLGAKAWWPNLTYPSVSFSAPYTLVNTNAKLVGNIALNASNHIAYLNKEVCGQAGWPIHISGACAVTAAINMEEESASGCTLKLIVFDADGNKVDSVSAPYVEDDTDFDILGSLYFPAAGDYVIALQNNTSYSSAKIEGITLSYCGGAVQSMPGTTNVNEAWFAVGSRADGKITFPNGKQDKGYVKWNVTFANSANYNVKLNINSSNGKKFKVALLDANGNDAVTPLQLNGGATGTPVSLEMGSMMVPAGSYTLEVTNNEPWSDAEWISVQFIQAGGGLVNIPCTLPLNEVMLSSRARIENDSILFTARGDEGHNSSEYAKWNIHSAGGCYAFTLNGYNSNANNENGQQYTITILSSDENTTLATKTSSWEHPGPCSCTTDAVELPEGNYVVKVQNIEWGSTGRVLSVISNYIGGAVQNISSSANTTLPVNEAWFTSSCVRDNGKTYIQYPSSSTSSAWIKWNIATTENAFYDITANINTEYAHGFTVAIYEDENAAPVTSVTEGTYVNTKGEAVALELGRINLAGGKNYVVKVTNVTSGSMAKLINVVFAPVVATVTALPGTLVPSDAILSSRAWVDTEGTVDSLLFTARGEEGYASNSDYTTAESGKWKVSVAEKGKFVFTANVRSLNGHNFRISVLDEAESNTIYTKQEAETTHYDHHNEGANWQVVTDGVTLEAGTYIVKIENYKDSKGRVMDIVAEYATIVLDEMAVSNSVIAANKNLIANIQLTRTFKGGVYNTISLPFAVSSEKVAAAFGAGVEILYMSDASLDGEVLDLVFSSTGSIYQGTPYLIKPVADVVDPEFSNVCIVLENAASTSHAGWAASFRGTFIKQTIEADENNLYLGTDDKLYFSPNDVTIKGLRAYFKVNVPNPALAVKRARIVTPNNMPTEIDLVGAENQTLKTIENGQLIILFNGQMYNVMGVKLQ